MAARYDFILTYGEDQGKLVNRRRVDRVAELIIEPKPAKSTDEALLGACVIETTHNHLDEHQIWDLYMTLTRVENAFRSLKKERSRSSPDISPVGDTVCGQSVHLRPGLSSTRRY